MESQGTPNMATDVLNEMTKQMGNLDFSSQEEINDFTSQFMENQNKAPVDDFLGLSATNMRILMHTPHGSPNDIMSLNSGKDIDQELLSEVPVLAQTLFLLKNLAESDKGVKATQKGNLPRALVQAFYFEFRSSFDHYFSKPMNQQDLQELDLLIFILKELGLIKKRTGWISLTKKGTGFLDRARLFELFTLLFNFHTNSYSWLSITYYDDEFEIIQQTMSFALYIIKKKAQNFIDKNEIAALFHTAFPMIEDPQSPFTDLFLDSFCVYFGLLEWDSSPTLQNRQKIRKYRQSPLFLPLLKWRV